VNTSGRWLKVTTTPSGDGRIEWRDGAHLVSLEARRAAVRAALEAAGFTFWSDEA
jgi:hypothetical protein